MNIVFLMDPLETVNFDKDTTLALMWGAQRRGHRVFYLANTAISLTNAGPFFNVTEIHATHDRNVLFLKKENIKLFPDDIDILFIRTDPPFDNQYLLNTLILDRMPDSVVVVNNPAGVRTVNEKLWPVQFSDIIPPTLVTQDKQEMKAFLEEHEKVVVKPTGSYGGQEIFVINPGDVNHMVILETVSRNFTNKIILQHYINAATEGDKRILLLNGEPLGAILRVHSGIDHRNNIFAGGKCFPAEITVQDKKIIERLKLELLRLGLYFVGIDIIGNYLIEVNVTSPTCLQEMNRANQMLSEKRCNGSECHDKEMLENHVIEFFEKLAKERK